MLVCVEAFVFLILCRNLSKCQMETDHRSYATSVMAMTNLLETEQFLIQSIDATILTLQNRVRILKRLSKNLKEERETSEKEPEAYLSNPLNSFALIRRIVVDWPNTFKYLDTKVLRGIREMKAANAIQFPTSKDLTEAAEGIERIRRTHNLSPMDIAEGRLNGIKYGARLSKADLFSVGFEMFKSEKFVDAVRWTNVSINVGYEGVMPSEISDFSVEDANQLYEDALSKLEKSEENLEKLEEYSDFETICRGQGLTLSNESCRYNNTKNPFYILEPIKMEQLSMDPYITVFHDVLTNDEIDAIKYEARFHLSRAMVLSDELLGVYTDDRTTHYAFVHLNRSIIQRIWAITGLHPLGYEPVSALNYGLGGHYNVHLDFFHPMKEENIERMGDRIATILIYLNEVEQGGETVFPVIGLSVKPRKGSLLLWYNLKNNGEGDYNTYHGACPVVYGSKWVVSIWVTEKAQFRALPCYNP